MTKHEAERAVIEAAMWWRVSHLHNDKRQREVELFRACSILSDFDASVPRGPKTVQVSIPVDVQASGAVTVDGHNVGAGWDYDAPCSTVYVVADIPVPTSPTIQATAVFRSWPAQYGPEK